MVRREEGRQDVRPAAQPGGLCFSARRLVTELTSASPYMALPPGSLASYGG